MTTKQTTEMINRLVNTGVSFDDAWQLRRISMTLHRWHEMECGIGNGCIERDETTNKPYWLNSMTMRRHPIADREAGALRRLSRIMANYPTLSAYVQGDPRGAALYVGEQLTDSNYNRGIAVYK
jgi:hypothetical protein